MPVIEIKGIDQLISKLGAVGAEPDPRYKRTGTLEPYARVIVDANGKTRIVHWFQMEPFLDAYHDNRP